MKDLFLIDQMCEGFPFLLYRYRYKYRNSKSKASKNFGWMGHLDIVKFNWQAMVWD